MIDGRPHTTAIPEPLRHLPGFTLNMTTAEKNALSARYNQRKPWAFRPMGKPDKDNCQRYRAPNSSKRIRLRCRNNPVSMRASMTLPTTDCVPGEPCGCNRTITLDPDFYPRERQRTLYGTTEWCCDYSRRNLVESANADLKRHIFTVKRGFVRVIGLAKTGTLLAFAIAASNVQRLRNWSLTHDVDDPWEVALGIAKPKLAKATRRKRRRRRTAIDDSPDNPVGSDPPDP